MDDLEVNVGKLICKIKFIFIVDIDKEVIKVKVVFIKG